MWLRDRFAAGLLDESIRRRLLQENNDLTFQTAHRIALAHETASRGAKALHSQQAGQTTTITDATVKMVVNKNRKFGNKSQKKQVCYRCNSSKHQPQKCPFINSECHECGKIGHATHACRTKQRQQAYRGNKGQKLKYVHRCGFV